MRDECSVRARLAAAEQELSRLDQELATLRPLVLADDAGQQTLERVAACYRRRRLLRAQMDGLRWVLDAQQVSQAG